MCKCKNNNKRGDNPLKYLIRGILILAISPASSYANHPTILSRPRSNLTWRDIAHPNLKLYFNLVREAQNQLIINKGGDSLVDGDREQNLKKNVGRAIGLLKRAVILEPKRPEAYNALAHFFYVAGDNTSAERTIQTLKNKLPRPLSRSMRFINALIRVGQNKPWQASIILSGLIKREDPDDLQSKILTTAAEAAMASGRIEKAIFIFRRALKLDSKNLYALYGLAIALIADEQIVEAMETLAKLRKKDPEIKTLLKKEALFIEPFTRELYLAAVFEGAGCTKTASRFWSVFFQKFPQSPYKKAFQEFRRSAFSFVPKPNIRLCRITAAQIPLKKRP